MRLKIIIKYYILELDQKYKMYIKLFSALTMSAILSEEFGPKPAVAINLDLEKHHSHASAADVAHLG